MIRYRQTIVRHATRTRGKSAAIQAALEGACLGSGKGKLRGSAVSRPLRPARDRRVGFGDVDDPDASRGVGPRALGTAGTSG